MLQTSSFQRLRPPGGATTGSLNRKRVADAQQKATFIHPRSPILCVDEQNVPHTFDVTTVSLDDIVAF
jgi:hypothetical protein